MPKNPAPPAGKQFSPGLTGLARITYIGLRSGHMLFSFFILPLSILYIQQSHGTIPYGCIGKGFLVAGAVLWGMLYMMLSQFAYPGTIWGAFLTTGGLYANGLASAIGEAAARQDKQTWNLYESYMPFVALGLIASLLAAMVIALWET